MRFKLSDQKCEVTATIEVDDEKHPVHGYTACVDEADIRDSTTNPQDQVSPYDLREGQLERDGDRPTVHEDLPHDGMSS